jgi:hypothetical protein
MGAGFWPSIAGAQNTINAMAQTAAASILFMVKS